jgi:hypothetical protein
MEDIEGETLAARLARERVPFDTALTWATQIADALVLAHARGVAIVISNPLTSRWFVEADLQVRRRADRHRSPGRARRSATARLKATTVSRAD